jgi:hypothetical protein
VKKEMKSMMKLKIGSFLTALALTAALNVQSAPRYESIHDGDHL